MEIYKKKHQKAHLYCGDKIYFHCRGNLKSHQKSQLAKTPALCSNSIADGSFVVSVFLDLPTAKKYSESRRFIWAIAVNVHKAHKKS
jgi:hypothetical protein